MDDAIRAMTCLMIDPELHGMLIKGPSGSGKSSLIHSFSGAITGKRARVIPLNITDEQLFGCINIEKALTTGTIELEKGILGEDGQIILVDDVNLLPRNTSLQIMESVQRGTVSVEREGLSTTYRCNMNVVATANDREQPLSPSLSDLFDICVIIPRDPDRYKRVDVMNASSPDKDQDIQIDGDLLGRIEDAKRIVEKVMIPDEVLKAIVDTCDRFGVQGMRGAISAARVCRASASLDGRETVNEDDLTFALKVCIPHRRSRLVKVKEEPEDKVLFFGNSHMRRFIHDDRKELIKKAKKKKEQETETVYVETAVDSAPEKESDDHSDDLVLDMDRLFESIDLLDDSRRKRNQMDNHLVRKYIKDSGKEGRYVSSKQADNSTKDIAIDATIRYAAPYQNQRRDLTGRNDVIIMPSDLRQKIREKHTSCLFFFMVDNSGSLVIRARMRAVKSAIMSMLADHYVRKDSVAIMTFNEEFVGMLLPPTRSVGGVKKIVDDIPTGKRTPLSEALMFMHQYIGQYLHKHPADMAFVVLMTDAGANIPMTPGNDPLEESIAIASRIRPERMECVLVDTKVSDEPNENALKLSVALNAPYYKIEDLRSSENILK